MIVSCTDAADIKILVLAPANFPYADFHSFFISSMPETPERFKNIFEMDVVFTISKELEETALQEKLKEMNYMQSRQKAAEVA